MRQHAFFFCSAVSLLFCVATLGLWVRGNFRGDQIGWYVNQWVAGEGQFRGVGFDSDSGGIVFFFLQRESHLNLLDFDDAWFRSANPPLSEPSWFVHDPCGYPEMTDYAGASWLGFGYFGGSSRRKEFPMNYTDHFLVMPNWFLSILAAVLPTLWIVRWRRRRRSGERMTSASSGLPTVCPAA